MTAPALGWPAVEEMLDGILQRRYYTNHGPLAQALERDLARKFSARHAVAVTNPAIATVMMLEGLALSGSVLLSALAPTRCAQAVEWAGLTPVFCDVDRSRLRLTPAAVALRLTPDCSAILMSGEAGDDLARFAMTHGLAVCVDAAWVPGSGYPAMLPLPTAAGWPEAAAILTDDDAYAAKLRNIRSSYGAGQPVTVTRTANGRLSEAQAGLALLSLGHVVGPA